MSDGGISDVLLGSLVAGILVLLATLLILQRRRQRRLNDEPEEAFGEDDQETRGEAFKAFVKGRPTRRVTAVSVYSFIHGIVAIGMIGFVLYMVLQSAITDLVVRLILLVTFGVAALIVFIAVLIRRSKREKELLSATRMTPQ